MTAPSKIKLHRRTQVLELEFDGTVYELSAEYLRVFSPSAEVKGHGPGQEVLQLNKANTAILGLEPQGNYAIKILFSDGHNTGIYSWPYLHDLAVHHDDHWQDYLSKVAQHEATKDLQTVRWVTPSDNSDT